MRAIEALRGRFIGEDGDAEAFAAEHEPDDAELPILEAIDVRVGMVVEIGERAAGDYVFAA